ncbi:unnamed protein product [Amoebophrya sp. A25]|nr:unnamed protein product [Amoebophrya sp. A25]|eukprot:GSA25T00021111001.1
MMKVGIIGGDGAMGRVMATIFGPHADEYFLVTHTQRDMSQQHQENVRVVEKSDLVVSAFSCISPNVSWANWDLIYVRARSVLTSLP